MNRDELRIVIAQSLMDQTQWLGNPNPYTPDEALKLAGGVVLDIESSPWGWWTKDQAKPSACPLDHHMCPRAWTKEES